MTLHAQWMFWNEGSTTGPRPLEIGKRGDRAMLPIGVELAWGRSAASTSSIKYSEILEETTVMTDTDSRRSVSCGERGIDY